MRSFLADLYPESTQYEKIGEKEIASVYTEVEKEYDTIRKHVGIIDGFGLGVFQVKGDGAAEFLDGLTTRDIAYLNPGKVSECFFLDEKAEALGLAYVMNNETDFLVLVSPENAQGIWNWLEENKSDDVELVNLTEEQVMFFLEGAFSWKMVRELLEFPVETVALRDSAPVSYDGKDFTMIRIGRSGEYGYAFLGKPEDTKALLVAFKDRFGEELGFCGSNVLEICMMEVLQPSFVYPERESLNLFESGNQWFVQYDKEEYTGHDRLMEQFQEELESRCVGFLAKDTKEDLEGCKVYLDGEEVGVVQKAVYSYGLEGVLGKLLVKDEISVSGIAVEIEKDGQKITADTVSAPYLRPVSWDTVME